MTSDIPRRISSPATLYALDPALQACGQIPSSAFILRDAAHVPPAGTSAPEIAEAGVRKSPYESPACLPRVSHTTVADVLFGSP